MSKPVAIQAYLQGYLHKQATLVRPPPTQAQLPQQTNQPTVPAPGPAPQAPTFRGFAPNEGESAEQWGMRRLYAREGVYPPGWDPKKSGSVYKDSRGYETLPFGIKYDQAARDYLIQNGHKEDPRTSVVDTEILHPLVQRRYQQALRSARNAYRPQTGDPDDFVTHGLTAAYYQLGQAGFDNFSNMWNALNAGNTSEAIRELYFSKPDKETGLRRDSLWSQQTPTRVDDLRDVLMYAHAQSQYRQQLQAYQQQQQQHQAYLQQQQQAQAAAEVQQAQATPQTEPRFMADAYVARTDRTPESDDWARTRLYQLYRNRGANEQAAEIMVNRYLGPQTQGQVPE